MRSGQMIEVNTSHIDTTYQRSVLERELRSYPRLRIEVQPTDRAFRTETLTLTLTLTLTFNLKRATVVTHICAKGPGQKLGWKQTDGQMDRGDCITPPRAVGNKRGVTNRGL